MQDTRKELLYLELSSYEPVGNMYTLVTFINWLNSNIQSCELSPLISLVIFIYLGIETPLFIIFAFQGSNGLNNSNNRLKLILNYFPRGNDPNLISWVIYLTRPLYFLFEK